MKKRTAITFFSLVILLGSFPFSLSAQTVLLKVEGKICSAGDSTEILHNAIVFVLKEKDTIEVSTVDSQGKYQWSVDGLPGDQYSFVSRCTYFIENSATLTIPAYACDFQLNFALNEARNHSPNFAVFEEGVSDVFTGFDVNRMKHAFRKFEHFCIQFSYISYANANEDLIEKRLRAFERYLIDSQFNMSNVQFRREGIIAICEGEDCHDAIQGELITLDQKCD